MTECMLFLDDQDRLLKFLGDPGELWLPGLRPVPGQIIAEVLPAQGAKALREVIRSCVNGGIGTGGFRLDRVDQARWYELSAGLDGDGGDKMFWALVRDVTDRRLAEETLREHDRFQLEILQNFPAGVMVIDADTHRVESVNRAAADLIGAGERDIIGRVCHQFLCPAEIGACPVTDQGQEVEQSERVLVRHDGSHLPILKFIRTMESHGRRKLVEAFFDISERQDMEEKLRRESLINFAQMEISRALINTGSSISSVADTVHRWALALTGSRFGFISSIDAESGTKTTHTFSPMLEEAMGKECLSFPQGPEGYRGLWGHALNAREGFYTNAPGEHPCVKGHPLGRVPIERFLAVPVLSGNHPLGQIVLANSVRDYTVQDLAQIRTLADLFSLAILRMRSERELLRAKDQAERASRTKTEFLANMSHEVRTPLNGLLGMLQLLEMQGLEGEAPQYVSEAMDAGKRLLNLINDILDMSRVEAGKVAIRPEPFSMARTLLGIAEMFSEEARRKGVVFFTQTDPSLPQTLVGDEGRIRQILVNLVGNAVKFTPLGTVTLEVTFVSQPKNPGEIVLILGVTDTGIGISREGMTKILEPFSQADGSVSKRFGGTGLGLAITKRLVQLMRGTLLVDSEPEVGTTVVVAVPVGLPVAPQSRNPAQAAKLMPSQGEAPKILLVEDDALTRKAVSLFLTRSGYEVILAENGRQALQVLARERMQAVLMDIQMPEMGGLEAVGRIRQGPDPVLDRSVPVVALTAYAMTGDRERFLAAGMDDYLAKPVDLKACVQVLERIVSRQQGR